ncbi:MAG: LEA type 2 family protein, partial [candidate division WOR-3 bacterium]
NTVVIFLSTLSNCSYINQVKTLKSLEYEVESFEYKSFDLTGVNFDLNLKVFNPNKVDINFERVVYKIYIDTKNVGEGISEKTFLLKKNSSGVYSTNLKIKYSILSTDIIEKIKEGKLVVDVEGEIQVKTKYGKNIFPFKVKKDISKELDFLKIGK